MRRSSFMAVFAATLFAAGVGAPTVLLAQRAEENVTTGSEDAFGRSIGNESIGIYNEGDVRGFSPIEAGNVRIEGLYFDRLGTLTSRLVEGSTIRVGIASQSYPFPSPTGIVDYDLRRVGSRQVISALLNYGPFDGVGAEVDAQIPLIGEKLGVTTGLGLYRDGFPWGAKNEAISFAIAPQWRPSENFELRPFFSRIGFRDEEAEPLMLTAGGALPPKVRREHYYGQRWSTNEGEILNYGVLGAARLGGWTARLGLFESVFSPDAQFAELFTEIDAAGNSNELVIALPESRYSSKSGELRLSRAFEEAERRHTLQFAARGRLQKRRYGGEDVIDVGPVQLGVGRQIEQPDFVFGEQSHDEVEQHTFGAAYELQWAGLGEMSVGLQKTSYSKTVETPTAVLPESRANPWLKYATATVNATERVAFYASYTEGLEESPVAPNNALNRNEAAPALETEQYDAGLRWSAFANMKLIAGVFNVEKPYFDVDAAGFFTELGTVEHRGVEFSLAGDPRDDLTVIVGTRWLDAKVSGATVDAGLIGEKPVGSARQYSLATAEYRFAGTGASIDATVEHITKQVATSDNSVYVPARAVMHVGGRYRFTMFEKPVTLRLLVQNVTDKYGWTAWSSGVYSYNSPRRFTVYLTADL
ncbi:MAG TPA: TonB-dependent receptor [Steroidobacteraceae bacterium]|nr:TonB-dependent receptor [Steroidobacteraceae bacterium]